MAVKNGDTFEILTSNRRSVPYNFATLFFLFEDIDYKSGHPISDIKHLLLNNPRKTI
jgi:hypothetical protein